METVNTPDAEDRPLTEREILRIKAEANRMVSALVGEAAAALREVLADNRASASVRVQAAQIVLKQIGAMEPEQTDLEAMLETAAAEWHDRG